MAVPTNRAATTLSMPLCLRGALAPCEAGDSREPRWTLSGGLVLGGLGAELLFRMKGRSATGLRRDRSSRTVLVPTGEWFEIQHEPFRARLEAEMSAWIQVLDGEGGPLTDSLCLGRPVRGCRPVPRPTFSALVAAETRFLPVGFAASEEFDLVLTGEITFVRGLTAQVTLRQGDARRLEEISRQGPGAVFDLEIVPPGQKIRFPEQPIRSGTRRGTLDSLLFLDGAGEPIGEECPLRQTAALP